MKKREADKMTLEQYMRELWLMDKQYGQEEELYPLINMLLRDGANTENLSIRDVHKGESAKNDKSRKYIDGFGSFPDIAIFDESFPDLSDENIVSNLQKIYGCVEAKCNEKNPKQIEVKIVAENKSEQPKQENYFIKRNELKYGYFFATKESIEKSTRLSPYKQRKATSILQTAGILNVKHIDIPPKTYYKINEEKLMKVLKNSVVHEVNN